MAVIKDVLVGRVKTSFDAVFDDLTGSRWGLELLDLKKNMLKVVRITQILNSINNKNFVFSSQMYDVKIHYNSVLINLKFPLCSISKRQHLHSEEGDTGEEVYCRFQVLQSLRTAGRKIVLQ